MLGFGVSFLSLICSRCFSEAGPSNVDFPGVAPALSQTPAIGLEGRLVGVEGRPGGSSWKVELEGHPGRSTEGHPV